MQRLTSGTLPDFIACTETAAILFGAPQGEATLDQAHAFAEAWIEHCDHADFAYVDAFAHVTAARAHGVRVLPTTLILHRGEIVSRFEGRCSAVRLSSAIRSTDALHQAAA